jgi:hypothetical protein
VALRCGALVAASLALLVGCKKSEAPPQRTEPWLANPSASAVSVAAARSYRFTNDSRITFSLSRSKGKISGSLPLAGGELRLDPRDLKLTRASLEIDLTQLRIETPFPEGLELGASTPDALALQWLELGPRVPAERRSQFSTARFDLTSLENLSAPSLGPSSKPSSVRATAIGTLLLHGFRAPERVEVVLSTSDSERLSIRSLSGLVVLLAPHDITARDPAGIVDTVGAARANDWVGRAARVEFNLLAQAEPVAN